MSYTDVGCIELYTDQKIKVKENQNKKEGVMPNFQTFSKSGKSKWTQMMTIKSTMGFFMALAIELIDNHGSYSWLNNCQDFANRFVKKCAAMKRVQSNQVRLLC